MDWTPLFNAIIALMGVVITVYLIPLLKSKLSQQELEKVKAYVNDAVRAAELLITGTKQGQAKKEWVINYLKEHGIKVDEERNSIKAEIGKISSDDSSTLVYVIPTNEELVIARDTLRLVTNR